MRRLRTSVRITRRMTIGRNGRGMENTAGIGRLGRLGGLGRHGRPAGTGGSGPHTPRGHLMGITKVHILFKLKKRLVFQSTSLFLDHIELI